MTGRVAALLAGIVASVGVARAGCLVAWHTAATTCTDGDACDADGLVDGACTFAVQVCVNAAGCPAAAMPVVRFRGAGAAAMQQAFSALGTPSAVADLCTADVPIRVPAGRRARLVAWARDAARGQERARLGLACRRAARPRAARAVVVTTDFETGLLATVGVPAPHPVGHPAAPINSDAVVRSAGGLVYVVNRFLGDNIQVLDPAHGFTTLAQCSVGPGSNPHDIAVVGPHKAYVTRYDRPELWIVNPNVPANCTGFFLGSIDLGAYAAAGGLPEMDQTALVGDRLFVSLERLDTALRYPAGKGLLVVIDTTSDRVVGTVELSGGNPFAETAGLPRDPGTGDLLVAEAGDIYRVGDGGIERVDPFALRAEGFFITETDLGGNITDFVLLSATKGYAVVEDQALHNVLVAFDPQRRQVTRRLFMSEEYLPEIDLAPDGTLWLADRTLPAPGIRIFDTTTDRQLTRRPIDVGLPPFAMTFVP